MGCRIPAHQQNMPSLLSLAWTIETNLKDGGLLGAGHCLILLPEDMRLYCECETPSSSSVQGFFFRLWLMI